MKDKLLTRIKQGRENVKCYSFVYELCKEAGVCTACKIRFADQRSLCRSCYDWNKKYRKWHYKNIEKKKAKIK